MLPLRARLTSPSDFARTTKSGIRVSSQNFVGYLYISPAPIDGSHQCAKAGLIIGKNVGGSVQRHRLSRQVRHALAPHLATAPEGALIVIRALSTDSESVHNEISTLISKLFTKNSERLATRKADA